MIEKSWSRQDIQTEFSDCHSLQEIIEKVTQERRRANELICNIRVNGEFLSEERERELAGLGPGELNHLEIMSQSQEELIENSLQGQIELIVSMKTQVIECYTGFRQREISESYSIFCTVLESCQFLAEALGLIKQNLNSVDVSLSEVQWQQAEDVFQAAIKELLLAYEAKDFQLAADVLEYELGESLGGWEKVLQNCLKVTSSEV
ncbi:MAG: hypothetical protein HRT45_07945 [Bdellovibrionales bacterium]|nr:hypothetical protein [Bdellovibrionales bacterium]